MNETFTISFLVEPDNVTDFALEISKLNDADLWDIFTYYQPTLVFHPMPIFGHA